MEDALARMMHDFLGRLDGPFHFRIVLQPLMAVILAFRDGFRDARAGRPAYFWSLCTDPSGRAAQLRDGWKSISRVFILAVCLDVIYQLIVNRWFYPIETLFVAIVLALIPYVALRGPANRIMKDRSQRGVPRNRRVESK